MLDKKYTQHNQLIFIQKYDTKETTTLEIQAWMEAKKEKQHVNHHHTIDLPSFSFSIFLIQCCCIVFTIRVIHGVIQKMFPEVEITSLSAFLQTHLFKTKKL